MSSSTGAYNKPTVSFTAPRIELDSIEAEKAALEKDQLDVVTREVYGKEELLNETDELVERSLRTLQNELDASQAEAYKRALVSCPNYVTSDDFLLMFLRAEKFNAKDAAIRMERYWESRLSLFGDQIGLNPRRIHATDLSDQDLASLHARGIQLLPRKDKAGRAIILMTRAKFLFRNRTDIARLLWYLIHVALEDEGVQKNGVVFLAYNDGAVDLKNFDRKLNKFCFELVKKILPLRVVAAHHFFDSKVMELVLPFLLYLMGASLRLRYVQHSITRWDTDSFLERLQKFGLLAEMLPNWVKGGALEFDSEQWLEMRQSKEREDG